MPQARGVDAVLRRHHFRKLDWRAGRRPGRRDRVVRWSKGPWQGALWTRTRWAELGRLYFRRWAVELFCRDLKQTLGMDVLRCQTLKMVEKEIVMHVLGYNRIRALMQNLARSEGVSSGRRSCKGTVDALRQGQELLESRGQTPGEPRAVKRRPKNFRRLTKPQAQMGLEPCRKPSQKPSKKAPD